MSRWLIPCSQPGRRVELRRARRGAPRVPVGGPHRENCPAFPTVGVAWALNATPNRRSASRTGSTSWRSRRWRRNRSGTGRRRRGVVGRSLTGAANVDGGPQGLGVKHQSGAGTYGLERRPLVGIARQRETRVHGVASFERGCCNRLGPLRTGRHRDARSRPRRGAGTSERKNAGHSPTPSRRSAKPPSTSGSTPVPTGGTSPPPSGTTASAATRSSRSGSRTASAPSSSVPSSPRKSSTSPTLPAASPPSSS